MRARVKFLMSCFVGSIVLWLALIGGFVWATAIAVDVAENPAGWILLIWLAGGLVSIFGAGGVVALGMMVVDEL